MFALCAAGIIAVSNIWPGRGLFAVFLGGAMASCSYVSSDGGFEELEAPFKGRDLAVVESAFEDYKRRTAQPDLILCRTTPRRPWRFWMWSEYLTHRRWDYPYRAAAARDGDSR